MRLLTFAVEGEARVGALLTAERVVDLTALFPTLRSLLEAGDSGMRAAQGAVDAAGQGAGRVVPLARVAFRPPVPDARKLLALAGNYQEHVREGGRPTHPREETYPYFFMKPPSTGLIGHGEAVIYPRIARKLDYEGELAVVVGRRGRHIEPEEALDHVAGYTVFNDISERALASKEPPRAERERDRFFDWLVGKWFDTAAPCGPWLVTRDEIPDPHALRLRTRVNGELRQDASTGEMIFTIPEILAFVSRVVTLEPGDIIATGTPSGVGSARGLYLRPGDTVEVQIEGIGCLRTPVAAEGQAPAR